MRTGFTFCSLTECKPGLQMIQGEVTRRVVCAEVGCLWSFPRGASLASSQRESIGTQRMPKSVRPHLIHSVSTCSSLHPRPSRLSRIDVPNCDFSSPVPCHCHALPLFDSPAAYYVAGGRRIRRGNERCPLVLISRQDHVWGMITCRQLSPCPYHPPRHCHPTPRSAAPGNRTPHSWSTFISEGRPSLG